MLKLKLATVAMGSLCLFAGASAIAGPNDYIRTPTVEYGEREIDFKSGSQRNRDGTSESATSIGYGLVILPFCKGATSRNVMQPWPVSASV